MTDFRARVTVQSTELPPQGGGEVVTWLYVPSTSFPSAPAALASTSGLSWQSQLLAPSVTWRGKHSPARDWSRRLKRASWLRRLCGAMSPPSEAAHGVAAWIGSLAASRASLIPSPASARVRQTNATSGRTRGASSPPSARGACSSKTSPACSTRRATTRDGGWSPVSTVCGETYTDLVSRLRRDSSRRAASAPATSASESSSSHWPTPAARDMKGANGADHLEAGTGRKHLDQLPNFVEHLWRSPTTCDADRGASPDWQPGRQAGDHSLRQQTSLWMTPAAEHHGPDMTRRDTGKPNSNLETQIAMWSTPRASDGEKGGPNQSFGAEGVPLPSQASLWLTPDVPNGGRRLADDTTPTGQRSDGSKAQVGLENQARLWPTPTALDRPRSPETMEKCADFRKRKANQDTVPLYLGEVAIQHSVSSLHHLETPPLGPQRSPARRSVLRLYRMLMSPRTPDWPRLMRWARRSTRPKLNPFFVEWLMGWPPEWINCACSATALSRWKQLMRSALSSLIMPPAATPVQLNVFGVDA